VEEPGEATPVQCPVCEDHSVSQERSYGVFRLLRCTGCGLVYAWPRKTSAGLYDEAYSSAGVYREYLELSDRAAQAHLTWAMRRFFSKVPVNGRLLDVGCSTGAFLLAASRRGWDVRGVDVSAQAAAIAARVSEAPTMVGTLADVQDQAFDAITAWETLEHVTEPRSFLTDAQRLLKPGGVLAISVPNWRSPWMRRSANVEHWPPYHLTFWEPGTLRDLFRRAGFMGIDIREKPFAWAEEVGRLKELYLPVALLRSALLGQRGMHLWGMAIKA
jgi:SAM-dependent methyltransferase